MKTPGAVKHSSTLCHLDQTCVSRQKKPCNIAVLKDRQGDGKKPVSNTACFKFSENTGKGLKAYCLCRGLSQLICAQIVQKPFFEKYDAFFPAFLLVPTKTISPNPPPFSDVPPSQQYPIGRGAVRNTPYTPKRSSLCTRIASYTFRQYAEQRVIKP